MVRKLKGSGGGGPPKPPRMRTVVSFDLLGLWEPIDALLEKARRLDPGANRANIIRELLVEALRARGMWKS